MVGKHADAVAQILIMADKDEDGEATFQDRTWLGMIFWLLVTGT